MPEGDTIHRTARVLHSALAGHEVVRFETAYAHLQRVVVDTPIVGRSVEQVRAIGKHLFVHFSGDRVLRTHMRMGGSWHVYPAGARWRAPRQAMRVLVGTRELVAVAFDVPVAEFHTARALAHARVVASLGPDLLADDFDAATALANLRARPDAEIAMALLDQRVVSGAGNVFKSEALFVAGVSPFARVHALTDAMLLGVIDTTRRLMRANVPGLAAPGSPLRQTTRSLDRSARLWVYGRAGRPCRRCGSPVQVAKQGADARVTFWCPACQRTPASGE